MTTFLHALGRAIGGTCVWRVVFLLVASTAAGLLSDWLRTEQRLVFPRPLPVWQSADLDR